MVLVDTSVWVELFAGRLQTPQGFLVLAVTCGPVMQEVVQGLLPGRTAQAIRRQLLSLPRLADPLPADRFVEAADLYAFGRRRGITIRSPIDCLIAAIAIEHEVPVWHVDRDFTRLASYSPLQIWQPNIPETAL